MLLSFLKQNVYNLRSRLSRAWEHFRRLDYMYCRMNIHIFTGPGRAIGDLSCYPPGIWPPTWRWRSSAPLLSWGSSPGKPAPTLWTCQSWPACVCSSSWRGTQVPPGQWTVGWSNFLRRKNGHNVPNCYTCTLYRRTPIPNFHFEILLVLLGSAPQRKRWL